MGFAALYPSYGPLAAGYTIIDLYNAVRPEIAATDGVAALNFDGVIELCKTAKQFKRPADADKCSRNLSALADAYLAKHP